MAPSMRPRRRHIRSALARARAAKSIDADEATVLLDARGADSTALVAVAGSVRDAGLESAGRPGVVTYSPKVFIPLTRLCRDRCHYCTFATGPGGCPAPFLSPDEVLDDRPQAAPRSAARRRCSPSATGPRTAGPTRREWLESRGYDSTLAYVRAMAIAVLEETGLLPHLNPGVMSWAEMNRLKPVAPSMGLMLETTSRRLIDEVGGAALRLARQGPRGAAADDRGRRPADDPVHHGHPGRHRRDAARTRRLAHRHPRGGADATATCRR